jgi:hypothetical protein
MLVLSVVAVAAIGVGTWQVVVTRSQLRGARQQFALAKAVEKYDASKLATEQRTVKALQILETTTTLPPTAPFAFVDPTVVQGDLATAESAVSAQLGYNIGQPCWPRYFLDEFTALEKQETALAEQGKPYFVPDPSSDAFTFIGLNQSCSS